MSLFLQRFAQSKKTGKFLPTSYVQGPNFYGSSVKLHVLCSRNWSFQLRCYYKAYMQWVLQKWYQTDSSHKNVSEQNSVSHCLSPTCPLRVRSKKKSQKWETSKSRLGLRRTWPSIFWCGTRMGPEKLFLCIWRHYWMPSRNVVTSRNTRRPPPLVWSETPPLNLNWPPHSLVNPPQPLS